MRYAGNDATDILPRIHGEGTLQRYMHLRIGKLPVHERGKPVKSSVEDVPENDPDGYDERKDYSSREFGDHMALEGETSHISTVIIVMYAGLAMWSYLTSLLTDCPVYTIPIFYVLDMAAFYIWHRLAHSEKFSAQMKSLGLSYFAEMHEMHMEHHLEMMRLKK